MLKRKKEFIEFMMEADVLRFGRFTTKSGRLSPYFINTGNYKTGKQLLTLGRFYSNLINQTVTKFDAIFGPAYKGIPLAAVTAAALYEKYSIDKPYFFNRKEAKDHGEGGNIVGYRPKDKDNIIIVEDVITAGTAIRETMPILRSFGDISVKHMFISVNRCEIGTVSEKTAVMEIKEEFGIEVHSIITVKDICDYLAFKPEYSEALLDMKEYMNKYCVF